MKVCLFFISLFMFDLSFLKHASYPCCHCNKLLHTSRLGPDGLCEHCFGKACTASDYIAAQGRCIDTFDNSTVDWNNLWNVYIVASSLKAKGKLCARLFPVAKGSRQCFIPNSVDYTTLYKAEFHRPWNQLHFDEQTLYIRGRRIRDILFDTIPQHILPFTTPCYPFYTNGSFNVSQVSSNAVWPWSCNGQSHCTSGDPHYCCHN